MKRILLISLLLLAVICTVSADRRRLLMTRNVAASSVPTPIFRLEMNEGSGVTMADSSGNGNTFTNFGATWITGKSGGGGALQFDGVNDFGRSVANITPTTDVTNWTFCAWVWWDSFANDDDLLCELSPNINTPNDGAWLINPNNSAVAGTAAFVVQDGTASLKYREETTPRWPAAEWVHLAVVFESRANSLQGEWTIYTNAVLATQTVRTTDKDQASDINANIFYLMSRAGTSLFADGRLDDVGIWGSALDLSTITAIKAEAR